MSYLGSSSSDTTAFRSKAGAMSFSLLMCTSLGEGGAKKVDYDEAQKLFNFICSNVELPSVEMDSQDVLISLMSSMVASSANKETAKV